ncbi:hypothetical protein RRG08_013883 [Elysia crispata]|uniref:Uncharacterized protein n=1 Tax=Elysia crispata TaxID=231223 RepID=A0AAE0YMR7_9GAST|nr:hypothetical protein RRG08_013883 [Elysia crispata]
MWSRRWSVQYASGVTARRAMFSHLVRCSADLFADTPGVITSRLLLTRSSRRPYEENDHQPYLTVVFVRLKTLLNSGDLKRVNDNYSSQQLPSKRRICSTLTNTVGLMTGWRWRETRAVNLSGGDFTRQLARRLFMIDATVDLCRLYVWLGLVGLIVADVFSERIIRSQATVFPCPRYKQKLRQPNTPKQLDRFLRVRRRVLSVVIPEHRAGRQRSLTLTTWSRFGGAEDSLDYPQLQPLLALACISMGAPGRRGHYHARGDITRSRTDQLSARAAPRDLHHGVMGRAGSVMDRAASHTRARSSHQRGQRSDGPDSDLIQIESELNRLGKSEAYLQQLCGVPGSRSTCATARSGETMAVRAIHHRQVFPSGSLISHTGILSSQFRPGGEKARATPRDTNWRQPLPQREERRWKTRRAHHLLEYVGFRAANNNQHRESQTVGTMHEREEFGSPS